MVAKPGTPTEGHLSVELTRAWDLRKTGQVPTGGKVTAGICCIFFHPADPTLCVITAQGPQSVLCFYNAISGGRLATVNLRGVAVAASFTKDGRQVVIAFRDWRVMILRPGHNAWVRQVIFWKKDPKPCSSLLLSLNTAPKPVVFLAASNQNKVYIIHCGIAETKKSRLLSSEQKSYTSIKLDKAIIDLSGHPQDGHQLVVMFVDGTVQGLLLEGGSLTQLYTVGDPHVIAGPGCLVVLPHPFISGSMLVLAATRGVLSTYDSCGRGVLRTLQSFPINAIRNVHGIGIDKVSNLLMVFGETSHGVLQCFVARILPSASNGLQMIPLPARFSQTATDVTQGKAGRGNVQMNGENESWIELWNAVPAWAQGSGQIGAARPRLKSVQFHSTMGAMAAQVSAASTTSGPHVLMWSMSDESHPFAGSLSGMVATLHTPLEFWGGENVLERNQFILNFPHHFYFLEENNLRSYSLAGGNSVDFQSFRPATGEQESAALIVLHSVPKRSWLMFFRKSGSNEREQWVYSLICENDIGAINPWFNPGISGAFLGPHDEYFAILQPDRITIKVYVTANANAGSSSVMMIPLPHPGLLTPAIFPGPPIFQLPMPGQNDDEENDNIADETSADLLGSMENGNHVDSNKSRQEDEENRKGFGVLMWINKFRQIVMGSLVVDVQKGERGQGAVEGFLVGELADGEVVIQVAWQKIIEGDESVQPNASACAMLTNQRVMIFLANGYPIASFPPRNTRGMATPPTSCIWAGPALLYVTQSGEVMQLLWDGSTTMICGAPSTTGTLLLAAVLADRILFLVRDPDTWKWETTTRHAYIGHALLMGWSSFGASGVMPPDWVHTHARGQIRTVCEQFDTSMTSVPVARALVRSGHADIAKVVADRWPVEADSIKVACSVAAGEWSSAEQGLLKEHQASVYYPSPAPKGSTLWRRLFSTSLGAMSRGHWDVAVKLLEAAGEWEHALVVAGLADNTDVAKRITEGAHDHLLPSRAVELERFKEQLITAGAISNGSPPLTKPDESILGDNPRTWAFVNEGTVPSMVALQGDTPSGLMRVGDTGPIAPLDRRDIKGYVFGASRVSRAPSVMGSMRFSSFGERSMSATESTLESVNETLQVGALTTSEVDDAIPGGILNDFKDLIGDDGFSSSDEETTQGNVNQGSSLLDDGASDLSRAAVFGKKFKIQIKSRDDVNANTSVDVLRDAAKKLRMGGLGLGPSLGPGGFAQALKGATGLTRQDSCSSVSSGGTAFDVLSNGGGDTDAIRSAALSSAQSGDQHVGSSSSHGKSGHPHPSVSQTSFPTPLSPSILSPRRTPRAPQSINLQENNLLDLLSEPSAQPPPREDANNAFSRGVSLLNSGKWAESEAAFAYALSAPGITTEISARAKQYLAAVLLMKARSGSSAEKSARLSRYASALKLDSKHALALKKTSIKENLAVKNYGYCSEEVNMLITALVGSASPQVASDLQEQLNICDRNGGTNSNIPIDEDLETIADIVGLASSHIEVKNTINDIVQS